MTGWSRSSRAGGPLYDRLGYSQDMITQGIGPQGQDSGGSGHHAPHAGPGHQKVPPDHRGHCHGCCGQEVHQQALPDGHQARVLGFGGVRPCPAQHQRMGSGGQGEVQDHRGLHVQVLQGLLEGEPWGHTAALQITGWHKDKATCLQLVMDEPPEQLYNQWIRDRMEFYKRVEPRDERLGLGDASTSGDVSTALWSVILSNPEKSGLAAIHSVAKEAILKGESR